MLGSKSLLQRGEVLNPQLVAHSLFSKESQIQIKFSTAHLLIAKHHPNTVHRS